MSPVSTASRCLFCAIAKGDIPATIVHETERLIAFLDIQPIRPGHLLIVPRQHTDYFESLPPDVAAEIMLLGQKMATAMKAHYGVERVGFFFTGTDIAHVHAHVVPMHTAGDITSTQYIAEQNLTIRPAARATASELAEAAAALRM